MPRWGLQHGRSIIPQSIDPARIAENLDVFDFRLTDDEPEAVTLASFGRPIPEP